MDAAGHLKRFGWRGVGHSLDLNDRGLVKPLLVSNKSDNRGVGQKKTLVSDQWWMRAFDDSLKELGSGNKTALHNIQKAGGIKMNGLYSFFVKGEGLAGTISNEEGLLPTPPATTTSSNESSESASEYTTAPSSPKKTTIEDGDQEKGPKKKRKSRTDEEEQARKQEKKRKREERKEKKKEEEAKKAASSDSESSGKDDEEEAKEKKRRKEKLSKTKTKKRAPEDPMAVKYGITTKQLRKYMSRASAKGLPVAVYIAQRQQKEKRKELKQKKAKS